MENAPPIAISGLSKGSPTSVTFLFLTASTLLATSFPTRVDKSVWSRFPGVGTSAPEPANALHFYQHALGRREPEQTDRQSMHRESRLDLKRNLNMDVFAGYSAHWCCLVALVCADCLAKTRHLGRGYLNDPCGPACWYCPGEKCSVEIPCEDVWMNHEPLDWDSVGLRSLSRHG